LNKRNSEKALLVLSPVDHYHFCDSISTLHNNFIQNNPSLKVTPYSDLVQEAQFHQMLCFLVGDYFVNSKPFAQQLQLFSLYLDSQNPKVQFSVHYENPSSKL